MKYESAFSVSHRLSRHGQSDLRSESGPSRALNSARLLDELHLHQIELEAQNAELRRQQIELEAKNAELQLARQESEAAKQHYAKFYDCSPVGYFTLDRYGTICELNPAGARVLGKVRHHLLHKRFGVFVEPDDRPAFNDFLADVFAGGEKVCCNVALHDPDSHLPPVHLHLEAVQNESGGFCNVVAVDVSERRRTELLREQYRADLEATVANRTAELTAANQELESFVYAASHDMKAPLARLSNLSALLNRKLRARTEDAEEGVLLDLIQQNAERLNALVDDLLAHTQIRQQPLVIRPVNLAALVQTVLQEQADAIVQSGADVRVPVAADLTVPADAFSLTQALHNLIGNALKYSAQATPPLIEIGARIENDTCRVWVRDNGIGIDPRYHARIFEIFRRLHTYAEYPGTGVGLALVKKAIERIGGLAWVESELGQGATFHLAWPV